MATRRRVLGALFASCAAVASLASQTAGIAAAAPPPQARILSLTLGRPVLPAAGGASALRLSVRDGVTCWVTAPAAVSVNRARHGCRIGRFATPVRLRASDSTAPRRFALTAWVQGPDGWTVRRTILIRQRGLAPLRVTTTSVPTMTVGSSYAAQLVASGGSGAYRWSVAAGSLPPGIGLSPAGVLAGTPASAGTYTSTVAVQDGSAPTPLRTTAALTIVVAPPAVSLAAPVLPGASVGVAYAATLGATGGTAPYAWAVTAGALPPGIVLSTIGSLSGTPTAVGTYSATVRAVDSSPSPQTAYETVTITVSSTLAISSGTLPGAVVSAPYATTLAATGGTLPYTWSVLSGSLPPGLTLAAGGLISGTPTTAGTATFTVKLVDGALQSVTATMTLTVASPLAFVASTLPSGTANTIYTSTTLQASGGTLPYTWSVLPGSGSLPPGLSLSTSGTVAGTPTTTGTYPFVVKVTDASSPAQSVQVSFSVTVS